MEEDDFDWIRGGNDKISHQRYIGSGGFGDVHAVQRNPAKLIVDDFQGNWTGTQADFDGSNVNGGHSHLQGNLSVAQAE